MKVFNIYSYFVCFAFVVVLVTPCVLAQEEPIGSSDIIEVIEGSLSKVENYRCEVSFKVKNVKRNRYFSNYVNYVFEKPKNIRIEWLEPKNKRGQIAVYKNGVLRAAVTWLPFAVNVDPQGHYAKDETGYRIMETDMGFIINRIKEGLRKKEKQVNYIGQEVVNGVKGYRYEIISSSEKVILIVDKNILLPICIEHYDNGQLIEAGYFYKLETNVKLTRNTFKL